MIKRLVVVSTVIFLFTNCNKPDAEDYQQPEKPGSASAEVVMYKNEGCVCCSKWADHMEENGFEVEEKISENLSALKIDNSIPYTLQSCHTAFVGDYIIEGHVPAREVKRLLESSPDASGIAVPGMPIGSPGMEGPNPEPYTVWFFNDKNQKAVFAEY